MPQKPSGADSDLKTGDKTFIENFRGGPYNSLFGGIGHGGSLSEGRGGLRALSVTRLQNYFLVGALIGGATIVLGPWIVENWREMLRLNFDELDAAELMPVLSNTFWINEWRKGSVPWRAGEAGVEAFYATNFAHAKAVTGRDMERPHTWFRPVRAPGGAFSGSTADHGHSNPWWKFWGGGRSSAAAPSSSSSSALGAATPPHAATQADEDSKAGTTHNERRASATLGGPSWTSHEVRPPPPKTLHTDRARGYIPPPGVVAAQKERRGRPPVRAHLPGSLPRAFVPLCGDSLIVLELAKMGYEVDAVDVSDIAIRTLVESAEALAQRELWPRLHFHLGDIFDAEFWREVGATNAAPPPQTAVVPAIPVRGATPLASVASSSTGNPNNPAAAASGGGGGSLGGTVVTPEDAFEIAEKARRSQEMFDLIYDRQALTAVNPRDRPDYAFLLKRALKPDGVIIIESVFRTPLVKGNSYRGPPFALQERDIKQLFPSQDGFLVKCHENIDKYMLDWGPEARVTGKIDPKHWETTFPCVVVKGVAPTQKLSVPVPISLATLG